MNRSGTALQSYFTPGNSETLLVHVAALTPDMYIKNIYIIYVYVLKKKCMAVCEQLYRHLYNQLPTNCSEQRQALFQQAIKTDQKKKQNQELRVAGY